MKENLYLLIVLFAFASFGQQKGEVTLQWIPKSEIAFGSNKLYIPQFQSENFRFDSYLRTIDFNLNLSQDSFIDENSLKITDVVFESITPEQIGDLSTSKIPSKIIATIRNSSARDKNFAFLSVSPIIKDGSEFKKILSFSYYFSKGDSS
jgi:hypothetical protein